MCKVWIVVIGAWSCLFDLYGHEQDLRSSIQEKLAGKFLLTTVSEDRADIVTEGSTVLLHVNGLILYSTATPVPPLNTYKNGKISQVSVFGREMAGALLAPSDGTIRSYLQRTFSTGERLKVTEIAVQKSAVSFRLYSDRFNGVRYYGDLKFSLENRSTITAEDVQRMVSEVLIVPAGDPQQVAIAGVYQRWQAPADQISLRGDGTMSLVQAGRDYQGTFKVADGQLLIQIGKHTNIARLQPNALVDEMGSQWIKLENPQDASTTAPIVAAEAPPPPIAPPPPSGGDPKTIAIGQSVDEVTASFGQPEKIIKLSAKLIYVYKDVKVTFVSGKVSDVE